MKTIVKVLVAGGMLALVPGCSKDNSTARAAAEAKVRQTEGLIRQMDRAYSNEVAFIKGVYGSDKPGEMSAKLQEAAQSHKANAQKLQERLKQEKAELTRLGGQ